MTCSFQLLQDSVLVILQVHAPRLWFRKGQVFSRYFPPESIYLYKVTIYSLVGYWCHLLARVQKTHFQLLDRVSFYFLSSFFIIARACVCVCLWRACEFNSNLIMLRSARILSWWWHPAGAEDLTLTLVICSSLRNSPKSR